MANKTIIEAAGAAFGPAKGEFDISGFMQGIVAIGKGIAVRDAKITKGLEVVENMVIDTDMEPLKQMFIDKQQNIIKNKKDINKGIKDLKQLQLHAKEDLPNIKQFMFKMQKEKFSNGANPLAMNYIDAYLTGNLEGKVKVKNEDTGELEETSTWMIANKNNDGLLVVGMNNEYVDPATLLKDLTGMVRVDDSKTANTLTTNFLAKTDFTHTEDGQGTEKWKTASTTYKDNMLNEFENDPNSFISFALDRKHTINGVRTSFAQEYLTKFLSGEEKEAMNLLVNNYALNQSPAIEASAVSDKVKGLLVREIMLGDPNLENDRNDYLDLITESQKPVRLGNTVEYDFSATSYSGYSPGAKNPAIDQSKLTKKDKRDYEVIKDIEQMISETIAGRIDPDQDQTKLQDKISSLFGAGLGIELAKVEGTENTYYFRKNMFGAKDGTTGKLIVNRMSPTFDITNKKQVRNIMPTILKNNSVSVGTTIQEDYFKYYNVN